MLESALSERKKKGDGSENAYGQFIYWLRNAEIIPTVQHTWDEKQPELNAKMDIVLTRSGVH